MGKATLTALLLGCVVINIQAQQRPKARPVSGGLSGKVFAITGGGDLKLARMVDVYVLLMSGAKGADTDTAGMFYLQSTTEGQESFNRDLNLHGVEWSERLTCLKELGIYTPAIIKTLHWAEENKKTSQITVLKTDEEGIFSVKLPAGDYSVIAKGRAGFNDAYWSNGIDDVHIAPGHTTELKLSSPDRACLDIP